LPGAGLGRSGSTTAAAPAKAVAVAAAAVLLALATAGARAAPPPPAAAAAAAGGKPSATPAAPAGKVPPPAAPAAPADHRRENKLLVRRYLTEVLAAGRDDKLDEIVAKSFVDRTPGAARLVGPAAVRQTQKKLHALFSKLEYEPQELIAEDDRVAARYRVLAIPWPAPGELPPHPLELYGVTLFRIRGGKIEEVFVLNDQVGFLRQLGYTLMPPDTSQPPADAAAPPPGAPPGPPPG
jgi:predicted ester cyclase